MKQRGVAAFVKAGCKADAGRNSHHGLYEALSPAAKVAGVVVKSDGNAAWSFLPAVFAGLIDQ